MANRNLAFKRHARHASLMYTSNFGEDVLLRSMYKLLGDYTVARPLTPKEEERIAEGAIVLPQTATKAASIGIVVETGSAPASPGKAPPLALNLKKGDVIWFQVTQQWLFGRQAVVNGELIMTLNNQDVIGRIDAESMRLSLQTFEPMGRWLLLDPFIDAPQGSVIVVPDAVANNSKNLRYRVAKAGSLVTNIAIGQEVIIDRRYANPVQMGTESLFYLDASFVLATADLP